MNDLEAETQVLTGVFGDTLSDPLWDFDYEMVQQRLERLLATGAIAGARVVDADGKPLAAALAAGFDPALASDHLTFDSELAAQTGDACGSLFVLISTDRRPTEVGAAVLDAACLAALLVVLS